MPESVIKSQSCAHHIYSEIKTAEITFLFHSLLCIPKGFFYVEAQDSATYENASPFVLISDSHLTVLYSQVE